MRPAPPQGDAAVAWYPVALADDIEAGTSAGTRLWGQELVVWRDADGQAHVWPDRCPHRGMRLSFGFVRGTHIACLYHGWQFGSDGRCRFIPAHPRLEVPATIAVDRLPCVEHAGLVWTAVGGAPPDGGASPDFPAAGHAGAMPVRSLAVDAPAAAVCEALAAATPDGVMRDGAMTILHAGAITLYAGVQPNAAGQATLHLTVNPQAATERQRISRWAEALRGALEAGTPAPSLDPIA